MKKHHLVVGTIIGGILLAATMTSDSTFALSDTSSTTDAPTSAAPITNTTPTTPSTPPVDGSVAGGSTATQTVANSAAVGSTNDATTGTPTNPPASAAATDTAQAPSITNGPSIPSPDPSNTNTNTTAGNNTTLNNNVGGTAQSGNATVANNGTGGDATSGNASGITTLVNAIASASDLSGGLQTFTLNLNGTKNGNILLDPNALLTLAGSGKTGGGNLQSDTQNNSTINNNVNLSATSGNANVTDNRRGGSATSGDATTEANIINLIESLISDKKAFLGVININGTLNGNILLPASVIDQLLKAKNGGTDPNSNVIATNNMAVNNNVNLSAQSGNASVVNNGHGGDATSGDATTKLNIYNMINSQIVGGNVLLVFVNVMGNWYGVLMNAPAGTTSAALGGGITKNNQGDTSVPGSQVFATNNETINNNVTLASKTGDATVSGNHRGGDATTGDASAVADIVNILGSQISLSGWLGILVINVFGTWNGSLQVQQAAVHHGGSHHHGGSNNQSGDGSGYAYYINYASTNSPSLSHAVSHVLDDTINQNDFGNDKPVAVVFDHSKSNSKMFTDSVIAGFAVLLAGSAGAARYFSNRKKNQQPPTI